jgi:SAM-dependent methyltransferase
MGDFIGGDANRWMSEAAVGRWLARMDEQERRRADQFAFIAQALPFAANDSFTFLDLGAGTGAASKTILAFYPNARAVLADYSPHMMGKGAEAMAAFGSRYRYVELDLLAGAWPAAVPVPLDAVVSSNCFHHLPDSRKLSLFREIRDRLIPGGWFFNFDPVRSSNPGVESAWDRVSARIDPSSPRLRQPRTPEEKADHEDHLRHIAPLEVQLGFLRDAGFDAVDAYWKRLDYAIYGGRRPVS